MVENLFIKNLRCPRISLYVYRNIVRMILRTTIHSPVHPLHVMKISILQVTYLFRDRLALKFDHEIFHSGQLLCGLSTFRSQQNLLRGCIPHPNLLDHTAGLPRPQRASRDKSFRQG